MLTSLANKLIILRDSTKYSQQYVADYLDISKSTYCRYEKGLSSPGVDEINRLLQLYNITYEDFASVNLPLKHTIVYPPKVLDNLEAELRTPIPDNHSYNYYKDRYNNIKSIVNILLDISAEAMNFPSLNLEDLPRGTTLKEVNLDMRGEFLIQKAFRYQNTLFNKMHDSLYKNSYI